jgi:hypothetical protein
MSSSRRSRSTIQDLLDLYVIAFDVGPSGAKSVAYLTVPKGDHGSWYTTDFNRVRVYKLARRAQAHIDSYGTQWAHLNPRVMRIGDIA